jgi:DNA helicase IV
MPSNDSATTDDDTALTAERRHLDQARACLRTMRAETLALKPAGGNAVATQLLAEMFRLRAQALIDDPATPLFFGRLDIREPAERLHVGRRHVHDAAGDPMVIDWRAPVARAFYRATRDDPMGLARRRRFGFAGGELTGYEDELFTDEPDPGAAPEAPTAASEILRAEIERPRVGPMRDIVATIQPEQDDIVRADIAHTVCVQGAPGTGKSAVGLHRAAYLLYAHRDRLRRSGVLVLGPNRAFLEYIDQVLPALGELEVDQQTLDQLVARVPVRAVDEPRAAQLKGDARMAEVLRRAVWSGISRPTESAVVTRGSRRWRLSADELTGVLDELTARDVRYGAGRDMLAQRIAHVVLTKMEASGDAPDDRVQDAVARSQPVRALVRRMWPAVDPIKLVFTLLAEPDRLAAAAEGLLDEDEQRAIRWPKPPRGPGSARWSTADAVLLDEAADLVSRIPSRGHVVLDEAQDLSPMACRAVGRRCASGSATVLGDLAQGTTPWAAQSWAQTLAHLGKPDGRIEVLDRGYRVPREIIDYASLLLPHLATGLRPPVSVRSVPGSLTIRQVEADALPVAVARAGQRSLAEPGTIAVIVADADAAALHQTLTTAGLLCGPPLLPSLDAAPAALAESDPTSEPPRVTVVAASLAKGLEYDHVLVVEPADIADAEPTTRTGLRRLYVVLTRAVTSLTVLHSRPLPGPLAHPN